jgi:ribosome-associated heat shock protein Hsp15
VTEKLRLDKWLWQARFFKTRSLAATVVGSGAVRVNAGRVQKPSTLVRVGDVLTFAQADRVRVIRIDALGTRRGPAAEAQTLYSDLAPPDTKTRDVPPENPGFDGKGRPTKKDRRRFDLSRTRSLE